MGSALRESWRLKKSTVLEEGKVPPVRAALIYGLMDRRVGRLLSALQFLDRLDDPHPHHLTI
jgi:hypothetical protein